MAYSVGARNGWSPLLAAVALLWIGSIASVASPSAPASAGVAAATVANEADLERRLERIAERIEQARQEEHIAGMALAIVLDDEVVFSRGFGLADVENGRPVTPQTLFAIGSTTKAFTSTLVGMLVDDGKMQWDDPVSKHIPYFTLRPDAEDGATITLRDALSHRSGFARMSMLWVGGEVSRKQVLQTASKAQSVAPHREEFHYNNVLYLAAGEAAAKAGRSSWDRLIERRLLKPLGMNSTTTSITQAQKDPRLALGYSWEPDLEELKWRRMRNLDTIGPAGSINSNVVDMAQWVRFLLAGGITPDGKRLINHETLQATQSKVIDAGPDVGYGMGWMLRSWSGHDVVEHGGNIDGFAAEVALLPGKNAGLVLLTNSSFAGLQQGVISLVFDGLFGQARAEAEPDQVAAGPGLERYVGEYMANFATFDNVPFTVSVTDDKLAVDVPGQMNYKLKTPDEQGKWYFEMTDTIAVSFDQDDQGAIQAMRMHQGGFDFELLPKGFEVPVTIPLDELQPYVGTYKSGDVDLVVSIQNNRLAIDPSNAPVVFELNPPDEEGFRTFRIRPSLQVRFDHDDTGRVVGFTRKRDGEVRGTAERIAGPDVDAPKLPTLAELNALRGLDARAEIYSKWGVIRESGKVVFENAGIEGTYESTYTGRDRLRTDVRLGRFGTISTALDGDYAAVAAPATPVELLHGERLTQARQGHPALLHGNWKDGFAEVRVVKADHFAGRDTWLIRLKNPEADAVRIQVDAATGDVLNVQTTISIAGGAVKVPIETTYEDFRDVRGLRMPHRTINVEMGNGRVVTQLERVESEVQLPAGIFRLATAD